ncbi:hypothetical protein OG402_40985 [Streptomyces anulatus]|uniref:hypothetical protein n=1 Tax=Streptomyces anulatus TaxID=1892 RepID=UPI00225A382C|nr:hypothetical protein [Streptomyces anulatus]MCX4606804.1 hypothetical protein [Streptomyces anulatus]
MDQDHAPQPAERCTAAHIEDPTPCQGPDDAVTILDGAGNAAAGCEHHGARMAASIDGARIEPGSVVGAATRASAASQTIRPFCWYESAPRTEPSQLSHAENAGRA